MKRLSDECARRVCEARVTDGLAASGGCAATRGARREGLAAPCVCPSVTGAVARRERSMRCSGPAMRPYTKLPRAVACHSGVVKVALECFVSTMRVPQEKDRLGPKKKLRSPQRPVIMFCPVLKSLRDNITCQRGCLGLIPFESAHLSSLAQKTAWTSSPSFRPFAMKCASVMKEPSTVSLLSWSVNVASCEGQSGWVKPTGASLAAKDLSANLSLDVDRKERCGVEAVHQPAWGKQHITLRACRQRGEGLITRRSHPLRPRKSARPPRAKDRCGSLVPSTTASQSTASVRRRFRARSL